MSKLNDEIRARVDSFVEEMTELVHGAALDKVMDALGVRRADAIPTVQRPTRAATASRKHARKVAGKPKRSSSTAKKSSKPTRARSSKRAKRVKRSSSDLARVEAALLRHIKANPGQRMEQIGKALKLTTKDLQLPARKLIAAKKVRTKGAKRATAYSAK